MKFIYLCICLCFLVCGCEPGSSRIREDLELTTELYIKAVTAAAVSEPEQGELSLESVKRKCEYIFDSDDELEEAMECFRQMPMDDLEPWTVCFLSAGMCQNHDHVELCEECMREVIEFVHGGRVMPKIPPTDGELRTKFREKNSVFVDLRDMILAEKVLRGIGIKYISYELPNGKIKSYWKNGDMYTSGNQEMGITIAELLVQIGISDERVIMYMSLLSEIGGNSIVRPALNRLDHDSVIVTMFRSGNVASSITKSIEFFPESRLVNGTPEHLTIVECTDNIPDESEWYSALGDGWFIHSSRS